MTGDDKRMTFVMFSTADWAAPYWTNKQHIADRLAKLRLPAGDWDAQLASDRAFFAEGFRKLYGAAS